MNVGDTLPELVIEVTATHIVAGAIATRDFMPVHHDRSFAQSQGAPDIFMNILSTNGHCCRYLTDWAGPDSLVRRLDIRLGVPVFPGSTLRFSGAISAVDVVDSESSGREHQVTVSLRAATDLGDHATGLAVVTLPA